MKHVSMQTQDEANLLMTAYQHCRVLSNNKATSMLDCHYCMLNDNIGNVFDRKFLTMLILVYQQVQQQHYFFKACDCIYSNNVLSDFRYTFAEKLCECTIINSFLMQALFSTCFPPDASGFCSTLYQGSLICSSNDMNFIAMGISEKGKDIALI